MENETESHLLEKSRLMPPPTMMHNDIPIPSSQIEAAKALKRISNIQCESTVRKKSKKTPFGRHDISCDTKFVDGASTGTFDGSSSIESRNAHHHSQSPIVDNQDGKTYPMIMHQGTNRTEKKNPTQMNVKKLRENLKSVKKQSEMELKKLRKELKQTLYRHTKEQKAHRSSLHNHKAKIEKLQYQKEEQQRRHQTLQASENMYKKEIIKSAKDDSEISILKTQLDACKQNCQRMIYYKDVQNQLGACQKELQSVRKHFDHTKREN